ncbi:hypothetical protein ACFOJ6_04545 [Gordonia humi]|uniref:hypothetical protein n=1 Tax=Gordonia humi TaxID=686429 RepID=UPI00361E404D
MKVGDSVRYSLDHWDRQEWEPAMLHACNAVDGTGKKRYPKKGVGDRFKSAIRDSMEVMAILGIPGIDLDKTRFPLRVRSDLPDKRPDVADVIYGIHRCSHGHGDELPDGFELTPYKNRSGVHEYSFENETARFPASVVLGLLAIAVFLLLRTSGRLCPLATNCRGGTGSTRSANGGAANKTSSIRCPAWSGYASR